MAKTYIGLVIVWNKSIDDRVKGILKKLYIDLSKTIMILTIVDRSHFKMISQVLSDLCNSISGLIVSSALSRMWFNFNFIIFNWSQNYFLLLISKIKFWNWIRTRIKRTWTGVWYPLISDWRNVFLFTIVIVFGLFWIATCSVKIVGLDLRSRILGSWSPKIGVTS